MSSPLARKLASDFVMLAFAVIVIHAPVLELLSIDSGSRANSHAHIPRGASRIWKYECASCAPALRIYSDMTRFAIAQENGTSIYASRAYFCNGTTPELCALARATYGCGATKTMADLLFFFTILGAISAIEIMRADTLTTTTVTGALCAIFSLVGIATASAQVVAIRAYSRDDGHITFAPGSYSIFAASCIEFLATIAFVGARMMRAYRRKRARAH